eukprot:SAG31_NODE_35_length_31836_cov_10.841352_36_plen_90_part_00
MPKHPAHTSFGFGEEIFLVFEPCLAFLQLSLQRLGMPLRQLLLFLCGDCTFSLLICSPKIALPFGFKLFDPVSARSWQKGTFHQPYVRI